MSDTDRAAGLVELLRAADEGDVSSVLGTVDRSDPATVQGILAAMRIIAEEFVAPASELLGHGEDGWTYFSLDDLAGYEYPGLIGGLLKEDFPTLVAPPPEDVLAERLEAAGFAIDDPARRLCFFRGWMAARASAVLETLADYLGQAGVTLDEVQLDALDELVRMDLRGATRWRLADLLAAVSPERARVLLETTETGYLRQALTDALQSPDREDGTTPPQRE
jgi:hypothetical protein